MKKIPEKDMAAMEAIDDISTKLLLQAVDDLPEGSASGRVSSLLVTMAEMMLEKAIAVHMETNKHLDLDWARECMDRTKSTVLSALVVRGKS